MKLFNFAFNFWSSNRQTVLVGVARGDERRSVTIALRQELYVTKSDLENMLNLVVDQNERFDKLREVGRPAEGEAAAALARLFTVEYAFPGQSDVYSKLRDKIGELTPEQAAAVIVAHSQLRILAGLIGNTDRDRPEFVSVGPDEFTVARFSLEACLEKVNKALEELDASLAAWGDLKIPVETGHNPKPRWERVRPRKVWSSTLPPLQLDVMRKIDTPSDTGETAKAKRGSARARPLP
jgi:hypothetical protein